MSGSCGNRGGDLRVHTWREFSVRQSQGGSQKCLQTQHKFIGGNDWILCDVGGWHLVAGARISNGCVSRSGGVTGSAKGSKKFKKIQEHNDRWAPRHGVCLLIHSTRLSSSPSTRRFSGNPSLFARIPMIIPIILGNQSKTELLTKKRRLLQYACQEMSSSGTTAEKREVQISKILHFP